MAVSDIDLRLYFEELWATRAGGPTPHSAEIWDERAEEWIAEIGSARNVRATARAEYTAEFLLKQKLIGKDKSVIDIGCGPGLFVHEFAKHAKLAVGLDYSKKFVEYGKKRAAELGLTNVSMLERDFLNMSVEEENMREAYDLVFASITPAATGRGCLEKLMDISKGKLCICSYAYVTDTLANDIASNVFDEAYIPRFSGTGFYSLINILWQRGYFPEASYYTETKTEPVQITEALAIETARQVSHRETGAERRVYNYLKEHRPENKTSTSKYGFVIWDKHEKRNINN